MNNETIEFNYKSLSAYQGFLKDRDMLLKSSSGGAARALIESIIKRKGIVFGVKYSADLYKAEYCYIDNQNEIDSIIGSKYIYADKRVTYNGKKVPVFKIVSKFLNQGKIVLFIGLGCDISSLCTYLNKNNIDRSKLFLVDLICQGPTLPCVQESYIKRMEKKYHAKAIEFSVRYKKLGWTPPYIKLRFENGKTYDESLYGSDFGFALMHYSREYCYHCSSKGENHKCDITLGDFWGLTEKNRGYNRNGVSILLVKTEKGLELLKFIDKSLFECSVADTELALRNNPMYYISRKKYQNQNKFESNIMNKGLHKAVVEEVGICKYYFFRCLRIIKKFLK